jgi:esterase
MHLYSRSLGEGHPLLILHGLFGSSDNWMGLAQAFAQNYRVIVADLRDHGQSPHSDGISYPMMAGDVMELIRAQGLEKPHLIGHSMGGKVVLQCAARHAAELGRLVVVDIAARPYPVVHRPILDALLGLDLAAFSRRQDAEEALADRLSDAAVRQFLLKNLARNHDGSFRWKLNLKLIDRDIEKIGAGIDFTAPVDNPALVIRGGASPYVADDDLARYREIFSSLRSETFEGTGHWVHAEQPERFRQSAERFLAS